MSDYVNFAELKSRVSILDVVLTLGLDLKPSKDQLRSACPACESSDNRSLVVTPGKGVFYCHEAKTGGDCIALVAHVNKLGMREAALLLNEQFPIDEPVGEEPEATEDAAKSDWQGLTYLESEHALVQELGFDLEVSKALGIGYAKKGIMRGRVAIPIRKPDGALVGYIGVTEAKLPNSWQL